MHHQQYDNNWYNGFWLNIGGCPPIQHGSTWSMVHGMALVWSNMAMGHPMIVETEHEFSWIINGELSWIVMNFSEHMIYQWWIVMNFHIAMFDFSKILHKCFIPRGSSQIKGNYVDAGWNTCIRYSSIRTAAEWVWAWSWLLLPSVAEVYQHHGAHGTWGVWFWNHNSPGCIPIIPHFFILIISKSYLNIRTQHPPKHPAKHPSQTSSQTTSHQNIHPQNIHLTWRRGDIGWRANSAPCPGVRSSCLQDGNGPGQTKRRTWIKSRCQVGWENG